jgi:hypothetical protein
MQSPSIGIVIEKFLSESALNNMTLLGAKTLVPISWGFRAQQLTLRNGTTKAIPTRVCI